MTTLRGMTWSHPRGYDPLVACSTAWRERTGVAVDWSRRSLQDFESFPVEMLARDYDLIVLDHPHIGQIVREGCLLPIDETIAGAEIEARRGDYCGASFASYEMAGHLWAVPIDAASQIQAWRDDLDGGPARDWDRVMRLASDGFVMCPLKPPHALMAFLTLAANAGMPAATGREGDLVDVAATRPAFERLSDLSRSIPAECFDMDPIDVYEEMAKPASRIGCAPLTYGYVNYGIMGFRPVRLRFADIPASAAGSVAGSVIGGTGLAISRFCDAPDEAATFASWVSSGAVQRGLYSVSGGQPAHIEAWRDVEVNRAANGFYRDTMRTLEGAWTRPRYDDFMRIQDPGSALLSAGMREGTPADEVLAALNAAHRGAQGRDGEWTGSATTRTR